MAKVIKGIEIPDFLDFNECNDEVVFEFNSTDKVEFNYASTYFHVRNNEESLKQFIAGMKIVYANCFYIESNETD